jgi:hypothetical protein
MQSPSVFPAGELSLQPNARDMLEKLYHIDDPVEFSVRLRGYKARRYTHLLKLCVVLAGIQLSTSITAQIIRQANTILHFTEQLLPAALTERGNSLTTQAEKVIITSLSHYLGRPLDHLTLQKIVYPYLPNLGDLPGILTKLCEVGRIKAYKPANGATSAFLMYYIPKQDTSVFGEGLIDTQLKEFLWQ